MEEEIFVPLMPPWAMSLIVALLGIAIGISYTAYRRYAEQRETASIAAFLDVVSDTRYWEAVREAGYAPKMRSQFDDGVAHVELTCTRSVSCAPPPTRANLKSTVLER